MAVLIAALAAAFRVPASAQGTALPFPWTGQDVGAVGVAGTASYAAPTFTIREAGGDIWGTEDAFQFVSQPIGGTVELTARVTSLQNTDAFAKAGITLRDSMDPKSPHVTLDVKPDGGVELLQRFSAGGTTSFVAGATAAGFPVWLRLMRSASSVAAAISSDGAAWRFVGSTSATLPGTVPLLGLAVTSHTATATTTATIDDVDISTSVDPIPSSPSPADGTSGISINPTLAWAAAGAHSYDINLGTVNPPPLVASNVPQPTYSASLAPATTYYWQIVAHSAAGTMAGPVWSFTTAGTAGGLPAPWLDSDVGSTGLAGSATSTNGVITARAAGTDIWGSADAFNYMYQPFSGDGQIVARVLSLSNTDAYAKAGVMFRDSSDAGSAHVILDVKPDGTTEFMQRAAAGGATAFVAGAAVGFPAWLRLARVGSSVTAAWSADGTAWTTIGSTAVGTGSTMVGLPVTSHNTAALATAAFDNVTLSAAAGPSTPATPTPASGATGVSTFAAMRWTAGGATSYDVAFGTSSPPPLAATEQSIAAYTPPDALSNGTTYFWQVTAHTAVDTAAGPVWSFTTAFSTDPPSSVNVWLTTADQSSLLAQQPPTAFAADGGSNPLTIDLDDATRYQQMDGFGASFTDSSAWLVYNTLSSTARAGLMAQLFDRNVGIGLSYLRQPMGASDFALSDYTFDDVPAGQTDPSLANFSIAHDRAYIIPAIAEALQINPSLRIAAAPWSPPAWMKSNGSTPGGYLNTDASTLTALANYFVKFLQQYGAAGVPIHLIAPQNEPLFQTTDYPSMYIDASTEATFVGSYLGPALASSGLPTTIAAYDHNWDNTSYATTVLGSTAGRYLSGSAWHCYGGTPDAMTTIHNAFPDKNVYATECSAFADGSSFQAKLLWDMENLVIGAPRNWARTVVKWNIALDQNGGPQTGGCGNCTGLVTIDRSVSPPVVSFNFDYYALGHISKFVQPGAYRIASNTFGPGSIEDVAFVNPDGSEAVIVLNSSSTTKTFKVRRGQQSFSYTLSAGAAVTFAFAPSSGTQ